ncbi:MAG: 50S ribosomal protein L11 [Alphaproteobacteria bacterium]
MAKKKVAGYIKLMIKAGKAAPAPPVGPALGSRGLNIMDFCKAFNAATQDFEPGTPIPVTITAFEDRSFTFETRQPPVSYFLLKAVGEAKGSSEPNKNKVGKVTKAQIEQIATNKMQDMNAVTVESAMQSIAGTARSMGIDVVES